MATLTEYGKQNPEKEVVIHTNFGNIELRLFEETPLHRANFVRNVKMGYYQDRDFYRLVKGVCIQGGSQDDPQDFLIPAEFRPHLVHTKGALSMARYTENNPEKMSSATEFFIISKGIYYNAEELAKYPQTLKQKYLKVGGEMLFDNDYTTFGEVTKGLDIVEKIARMPVLDKEAPATYVKFSVEVR